MAESGNWFATEVATFGDRLAGAREAAGLTQEEMAQRLGVRLTTVQAWEEDLAEPRGNRLQMLAGMLNVSLTWLLTARGDGLDEPREESPREAANKDIALVMAELRALRARAAGLADDIARVEKQLQLALG